MCVLNPLHRLFLIDYKCSVCNSNDGVVCLPSKFNVPGSVPGQ